MSVTVCQDTATGERTVGVIGSRTLPDSFASQVGDVVESLLDRGCRLATGGALGADAFCISRLLAIGRADSGVIHAPWREYSSFPSGVQAMVRAFRESQGSILWGNVSAGEPFPVVRSALLHRNIRLLDAVDGIVAFLHGASRGTLFTISRALQRHLPVVIFPIDVQLPVIAGVRWVPLQAGGCWEGGYRAVYLR